MAQITLYLDDETARRMRKAARKAGMSRSRWVARLIRERFASQWPDQVAQLAGSWKDFPDPEDLRRGLANDVPRERL